MANSIYQGKINRQFWGKLIRHFSTTSGLQLVTWGGQFSSNLVTFFHYDLKE